MEWITAHRAVITAVALAVLRFAESIVAITPSDKDNKVLAAVKAFFRFG